MNVVDQERVLDVGQMAEAPARPAECVHHLFEAQVRRSPGAPAACWGKQQISYRALNAQANVWARALLREGVRLEEPVAVCMERGSEMLAVLLGILKAGGAYVPLDVRSPESRLGWMLADSGARVLVASEPHATQLSGLVSRVLPVDTAAERSNAVTPYDPLDGSPATHEPAIRMHDTNLAYIIYTSGSTGRPKGVAVSHRSVVELLRWAHEAFSADELAAVLASTSYAFDISVFEIFATLTCGGTVVVVEDILHAADAAPASAPRLVNTVPSALSSLLTKSELPDSVRTICLAGEAVPPGLVQQLLRKPGPARRILSLYGPTEATVFASWLDVASKGPAAPALGAPLAGNIFYILDEEQRAVPDGERGELYIGGGGLARGYWRGPALTAERFIPDPFSAVPGARMYASGDLARRLGDGSLEFLGRRDTQIKLRGFRIELGEIEAVLGLYPGIQSCAVAARTDEQGNQRLVAYSVAVREPVSAAELRDFLRERLPEHMLPAAFVALATLPLTMSGKLDRQALPEPSSDRPAWVEASEPPVTASETRLAALWATLLHVSPVGRSDNFFQLGGHSLLAIQLLSRVREVFGVEMQVWALFEAQTLQKMAALIERGERATDARQASPAAPTGLVQRAPLAFGQEALWFLAQLQPESPAYNVVFAYDLVGPLDRDVLDQALRRLRARHESLHSTFETSDGLPVQVAARPQGTLLEVVDLSALPAADGEAELRQALDAAARQPVDLAQGPIMRAKLWRLGANRHVLFFCVHHIVFDTWSQDVFFWELDSLYAAYRAGRDPALPPAALDISAYAARQTASLALPEYETQMAHWLERLRPAPGTKVAVIELPWDHPRPAVRGFRGARRRVDIAPEVWDGLRALGRQEGVTLYMTLLAAFQTLLLRVSGQTDLYIGTPVASRRQLETEGTIGFLINTVVLRTDLSGDPRFHELIARVRGVVLDALSNQDTPLEKLVERLRPERSADREPLFQVMFAYDSIRSDGLSLEGVECRELELDNGTSKFDLLLAVTSTRAGMRTLFEYDSDLFDAGTIERLSDAFVVLLHEIVANPHEHIGRLSLVSADEQVRALSAGSAAAVAYERDASIPALFEAQAARTPDAVALEMGEQRLTYRALDERANQLASRLHAHGVRLESPVAVYLERSADSIVALLAILKAGGYYVPLAPSMPDERCAFIVADTRAGLVLTRRQYLGQMPLWHGTAPMALCVDDDETTASPALSPEAARRPDANNLAYVMYTSGSSGQPKGVAATQRAVLRLVRNGGYAELGPDQTLLHMAPLAFDASTFEIWGSLLNGGRLVICPDQMVSMAELAGLLESQQVTTLWLTAALFHEFVAAVPRRPGSLRQLLAGGDVLQAPVVQTALAQWAGLRIINGYGPTEGTTFSCCYAVTDAADVEQSVPIGRPIANTWVYVLDERMQPVPVGVEGELYIGGDGLARGYLNRPELTAELFVPDPFGAEPGGRLYRSGDRVRYRASGVIEFVGRKDRQLKIRGFRVEPAEIEHALLENSTVRAAVVVAAKQQSGDARLIAYVVGRGGAPVVAALREYLAGRLPDYMLPAEWVTLAALPVTPNGKVDLRALPAPQPAVAVSGEPLTAHDQVEQTLVTIWEELLNRRPVGVRDNFFALGGHSLTAVRVVMRIARELKVELPVAVLFRAPTIERLAAAVRGSETVPDWATLVPIQPAGGRPPFFCVHGLGGGVLDYGELARRLGPDQPFYGLQARGLDGAEEPHDSIEAMAAHYVDTIRTYQPRGPYYLGGYCFGGVIAYEMARQLAAEGQTVGLLAILEGYAVAQRGKRRWLHAAQWRGMARNLPYWLQDYGVLKLRRAMAQVRGRAGLDRLEEQREWDGAPDADALAACVSGAAGMPAVYARLMQAQLAAIHAHRSGRYAGRVTLFRVRALAFALADDPQMGWGRLSEAGVTVRMIPGAHYNILAAPNVERLAAELRACLEAAQEAQANSAVGVAR